MKSHVVAIEKEQSPTKANILPLSNSEKVFVEI